MGTKVVKYYKITGWSNYSEVSEIPATVAQAKPDFMCTHSNSSGYVSIAQWLDIDDETGDGWGIKTFFDFPE